MKSEHRHDLETNMLARQLAELINRVKPHASTISTVALIVAGLVVAGMYFSKSMAAKQGVAWEAYHLAIEDPRRDALDDLKQAAEQNAGSPMAELAQVTWADGKLMQASRQFIPLRAVANENLDKAEAAYQSLLKSASSSTIRDRAHFGLGRVYEMRNDLEKAREHYGAVVGGFVELARQRVEQLQDEQTIEACAWLASAQAPRRPASGATGSTGSRPEFEADELSMSDDDGDGDLLGDLLDDMVPEGDTEDRYGLNLDLTQEAETDSGEEPEMDGAEEPGTGSEEAQPEPEADAADETPEAPETPTDPAPTADEGTSDSEESTSDQS